ncbi:hypothetical protein BDV29DRAFT_171341 [Aspergillus leporis]|uniref:Uncharacterized protein n=1 Tax=Aspergillus leporis TaxID=41062 RepID=A0A5N5X4Y8_9EURO|nr:hypothetical protein BDV29DRAFT_171341 [Aspergillus leporis]
MGWRSEFSQFYLIFVRLFPQVNRLRLDSYIHTFPYLGGVPFGLSGIPDKRVIVFPFIKAL